MPPPWSCAWASSLGQPTVLVFIAAFSTEQVDEDMDLRWAEGTRFLGGESNLLSGVVDGLWKVRREGTGIPCGRGEEGSFWNRDLRCPGWRGGTFWGVGSEVGCDWLGTWAWLDGLRMLENHFCTADAGEKSCGESGGVGVSFRTSELFRLCFAVVLDSISPLKLSAPLYLFVSLPIRLGGFCFALTV